METTNIDQLGLRFEKLAHAKTASQVMLTEITGHGDFWLLTFKGKGKRESREGWVYYSEVPDTLVMEFGYAPDGLTAVGSTERFIYTLCKHGGYYANYSTQWRRSGIRPEWYSIFETLLENFERMCGVTALPVTKPHHAEPSLSVKRFSADTPVEKHQYTVPNLARWEGIQPNEIGIRNRRARNYRKMALAQFELELRKTLDHAADRRQREDGEPPMAYWQASAGVLGVSPDWLVFGQVQTEVDAEAEKTPLWV